jgi:hypothetical protein
MHFSSACLYVSFLMWKCSLQYFVFLYPQSMVFASIETPNFTPTQTTDAIIVMYVLMDRPSDTRQESKICTERKQFLNLDLLRTSCFFSIIAAQVQLVVCLATGPYPLPN